MSEPNQPIAKHVQELMEMERVIKAERDAREAAESKLAEAREALNKIASWAEGHTVRSHFDEPASAMIAREAIEKITHGDGK